MKYFVYNYLWRVAGEERWSVGTDLMKCESVIEVYESSVNQPEIWSIQSICEITKKEYDAAKKKGLLG